MLFDSVSDMIASLRLKAVNALTNSLSESERSAFLEKFQPQSASALTTQQQPQHERSNSSKTDQDSQKSVELKIDKSIAEAVAEARAQEAQRKDAEWQIKQEEIREQAERAAYARVQAEYELMMHHQQQREKAFNKWKQEVDLAKQSLDNDTATASTAEKTEAEATTSSQLQESEKTNMSTAVDAKVLQEQHHPLLGPLVSDLGYKRVYTVDPRVLSNIPVWEKQRIYRHDRAKVMAADKMKSIELGLVGNICLHEDSNGKLRILDGQHRVGMITILAEKIDLESSPLREITVEVYRAPNAKKTNGTAHNVEQSDDDSHAKTIFVEVNKAESVKLVDMPGVAKGADRKTISEAAERLKDKFPDMFKPSQSCRPPHLNIDNLRDNIFAAGIIHKHGLTNAAALEKWMMAQNEILESRYNNSNVENKNVSEKALEKAKKFNFYLGLDSSWYYN